MIARNSENEGASSKPEGTKVEPDPEKTRPGESGEGALVKRLELEIAEGKKRGEVLQKSVDQLLLIADTVPVLISYVDKNGYYRFNNREYERWFGHSREELSGKHIRDVVGPEAWRKVQPRLEQALAGEKASYEDLLPYKHVGARWVAVTYMPHRNDAGKVEGAVVLVSDVTERKKLEEAYRRESLFNATVLGTTAALIVVIDPEGRIVQTNHAFEIATGFERGELKGEDFLSKFIFPDEVSQVRSVFEALKSKKGPNHYTNFLKKRNGERLLIEWSSNVIFDEEGKVLFVVGTGLDISARRTLEKELLLVTDRERQRIGRDLHDGLGQELTALEFYVHTLRDEIQKLAPSLEPAVQEVASRLRSAVRHSRIIAHGLAPVGVDPDGLLLALRKLAESASSLQKMKVEFAAEGPFTLRNPEISNQLYRIAGEALNNALKHSRARKVLIALKEEQARWKLTISDDGIGCSPAGQSEEGLGLQILQYRAELIQGTLRIDSKLGKGTKVICSVPKSAGKIKRRGYV